MQSSESQHIGEYSPEREYRGSESSDSGSLYKQPVGENASYYGSEIPPAYNTGNPEDAERGLGSTLIGGAGGAYVGHHMGGGGIATAGGAIIGALGANAVSHGLENHHQQQQQQQYQQQYQGYGGYPPQYFPQAPPQAPYPGPGYQQGMPVTAAGYGGGLFGRFGAGRLAGQDVGRLSHCQRKRLARLERKEAKLLLRIVMMNEFF
ncbi:hypothetical protein N7540_000156 [Penicillium herquei]|nr:hypothetical protein N7540_000156 [Penicillium herquei]